MSSTKTLFENRVHDPYAGAHPLERALLESCKATPEKMAMLQKFIASQNESKVVMQNAQPLTNMSITDMPKLEPGQRPDRSHVVWPLLHSVVDAAAFILAGVGVSLAAKYMGWLNIIRWVDIFVLAICLLPVGVAADWYLLGNRSIMSLHTTPKAPPVLPVAPEMENSMGKQAHTLRLEITQPNGRLRHIVDVMPEGWDMDKLKDACESIKRNSMVFSQNAASLSSFSFGKLRSCWLDRGLIEPHEQYPDRYQLNDIGTELVNSI